MDYLTFVPAPAGDGFVMAVAPRCHEGMSDLAWDLHCELEAEVSRAEFNLREAADVAKGLGPSPWTRAEFWSTVVELERLGCIAVYQGINANGDGCFTNIGSHGFSSEIPAASTFFNSDGTSFTVPAEPRRPKPTTGPLDIGVVYILKSHASRLVKIGHSGTLLRRVGDIQRMSPVPLSVLWTYPGGKALEGTLHQTFKDFRQHGEWFDFGDINPIAAVAADVAWTDTETPDWGALLAQQDREIRAEIEASRRNERADL